MTYIVVPLVVAVIAAWWLLQPDPLIEAFSSVKKQVEEERR